MAQIVQHLRYPWIMPILIHRYLGTKASVSSKCLRYIDVTIRESTTQSRFTFNICKVFPPHVGGIFVPQDQREILQERQLINNPVTWSLMAHKKMNLMTSRKIRVGGEPRSEKHAKKSSKSQGVCPLEDIYTHIYIIYIYIHVSEIVLIRKFPHIYLWVIKYRLEIPKMNLHGRSKSRRWIFHLLSFFYYLIHHPQE